MDNTLIKNDISSLSHECDANKPFITSIHEKLNEFETSIVNERVKQKQCEDSRFNNINESLSKLNAQLRAESQDRLNSRETLKILTEKAANDMLNNVQCKLTNRVNSLAEKLDALINRCVDLESSVSDMDNKVHSSSEIDLIRNDLNDLNRNMNNDIALKLDKDASLVDKLSYIDYSIQSKINDGILLGTDGLKDISNEILQLKKMINSENDLFHCQVIDELENIKQALDLTTKARKESDDSIVEAIDQMMSILPKTDNNKS